MIIKSDKINCYIEGIRIPINSITVDTSQNQTNKALLKLALGKTIIPHLWANALIQVTYIEGITEKLFFQGLVEQLEIIEDQGFVFVWAVSLWQSLNINTTLDYVVPKKYGISNIEDETTIYLGNEEVIKSDNSDVDNYQLSLRYFFLDLENQDVADIPLDSSEAFKLQFIADRTPFAILFAYSLFELIAYDNFLLSRAYIDKYNLLSKVKGESRRDIEFFQLRETAKKDSAIFLELDTKRSGIAYEQFKVKTKANEEVPVTDVVAGGSGTESYKTLGPIGNVSNRLTALALGIQKIEGYFKGSRSYRNNNPGNIEYGKRTISYGAIGTDGRFAKFPDYETGLNALKRLITDVYINNTLFQMISKYAPPSENDTKSYANSLASALGVKITDKVSDIIK